MSLLASSSFPVLLLNWLEKNWAKAALAIGKRSEVHSASCMSPFQSPDEVTAATAGALVGACGRALRRRTAANMLLHRALISLCASYSTVLCRRILSTSSFVKVPRGSLRAVQLEVDVHDLRVAASELQAADRVHLFRLVCKAACTGAMADQGLVVIGDGSICELRPTTPARRGIGSHRSSG